MRARISIAILPLLLAACGEAADPAKFDKGEIDPALAMALEDQILIDPTLSQQANEDAIRPPDRPVQILLPKVAGADSERPLLDKEMRRLIASIPRCNHDVAQSFSFAARLPPEFALPDKAVVRAAAGSDAPNCALRLVDYWVPTSVDAAVRGLMRRTARKPYIASRKAQGQGVEVKGYHPDGAIYIASFAPSQEGTAVRLLSNRGG